MDSHCPSQGRQAVTKGASGHVLGWPWSRAAPEAWEAQGALGDPCRTRFCPRPASPPSGGTLSPPQVSLGLHFL